MTAKVRLRVYFAVIGALMLALVLRTGSDATDAEERGVVEAVERRDQAPRVAPINTRESTVPVALFAIDEPVALSVELPEVQPELQTPAPSPPEVTILGWMQAGATPHVFVEWQGDNHALTPSQELDGMYRFEGIDQGMAEFTYLPEQTTRLYRVGELGPGD